jgi:hypothetical protein
MKNEENDELNLNPEDRRFIDVLRQAYAPSALTPARRGALRQRVEERLERRWRPWVFVPVLGSAVAVAVAAWLALVPPGPPPSTEETASFAWEETLFLASDPFEVESDVDFVPDDYEAIAAYFVDV